MHDLDDEMQVIMCANIMYDVLCTRVHRTLYYVYMYIIVQGTRYYVPRTRYIVPGTSYIPCVSIVELELAEITCV